MHEIPMPDSEERIDDHEDHGFDGLVLGVDGSCELDDKLIIGCGKIDSKVEAIPH